ncbi:AAA family ATPase [Billgrantia endophytica]|uniref:Uncharacterized protein n=1 Tax=Billgrantia endophytica TaxID=2033802 RepID=A0A2N7U2P0_9GAMM|nr:bifunctional aminoglycoside phosphotransferase/ATP-binding protein [Halomonas endophytica]PMR74706.1 hypothetical protein C1H69_12690 [Halomonas endophytica]
MDATPVKPTNIPPGGLCPDELVDSLVAAHRAPADEVPYGGPSTSLAATRALIDDELSFLMARLEGEEDRSRLACLGQWLEQELVRLGPYFAERGEPRPSWVSTRPAAALCDEQRLVMVNALDLEPDDPIAGRALDTGFDVAALLVGLAIRGETRLANRALDRYLRLSGDYSLMRLLSVFRVCRSLSGARRALQRPPEIGDGGQPACLADVKGEYRRYLALADQISEFRFPPLIIGVGVSGSGKSRFTAGMVERLGAIRLCSDAERRRLYGMDPQAVDADPAVDIFSPDATVRTYRRLASLAGTLLEAGFATCVDATCLTRGQRKLLCQQAEARGLPVLIVSFEADDDTLKARITKRAHRQGVMPQASLEVLRHQQATFEDFDDEERHHLVHLDTTADNATEALAVMIQEHVRLK